MIPVVVASVDVARGSALAAAGLRVQALPERYAPPGALTSIQEASGRVALSDLAAGEVVTTTRLARVRAGPVASLVPEGLRAFAVPTSLPPGAVAAGDHVDVLATYGGGPVGQPHTETVVEGVEILFVLGDEAGSGSSGGIDLDVSAAGGGSSLTLILLVSPDQEERLAFARAFSNMEVAIAPVPAFPGSA